MIDMFSGSGLSVQNYSDTLIGWGAQLVQNTVSLGALSIKYFPSAIAARAILTDTYGWLITDG